MANNTTLSVKSASFEEIKQDLIDYLQKQTEFADYDFAGSRLSQLLNILTYAVIYIQQYSNAAKAETNINTALKRSSIVQLAQDMGYIPPALSASTAPIRIVGVHTLNPSSVTIPAGTRFTGSIEDTISYDFVTWDDIQMLRNSDNTYTSKFSLVQGVLSAYETTYKDGRKIIIKDTDIDRDYLRVYVDSAEWTNWSDKSIVNTTGGSTVFYMRETVDGSTEIYFGEGSESADATTDYNYIGGLKPADGQTIRVEFLKTSGKDANGCTNIAFADSIDNFKITSITENPDDDANYVGSSGGGDRENIERIRIRAPLYRETQRRCVTKSDYESFVTMKFGSLVQAIQCYGDSDRPGYAFIAIKPTDGLSLTTTQKDDIESYLSEFNIVTITPKVVDPDYLYIKHNITLDYKPNLLSEGTDYLKSQVVSRISDYYNTEVEVFDSSFSVSKMLTYIDAAHASIVGSQCDITLVRELTSYYQTPMAGVSFMNPVDTRSVVSSDIAYTPGSYTVNIKSTDSGYLVIGPFSPGDITGVTAYAETDFDNTTNGSQTLYYNIGTINYITGRMDYDFGALNSNDTDFNELKILINATPTRTSIFVDSGSLIVYEYDLRPEYTVFDLEAIS